MIAFLIFAIAAAVSIWAIWITVAPRWAYMRALYLGKTPPALVEERKQDDVIRIERRAR